MEWIRQGLDLGQIDESYFERIDAVCLAYGDGHVDGFWLRSTFRIFIAY